MSGAARSSARQRGRSRGSGSKAKKQSQGPCADAQGRSVDASKHIDIIKELLADGRPSKQLDGFDFSTVSDEHILELFNPAERIGVVPPPPLHHRRNVSQLRTWFNRTGKSARASISEEADDYEIISCHFQNPVWSETCGWIEWSEITAAAASLPSKICRGITLK